MGELVWGKNDDWNGRKGIRHPNRTKEEPQSFQRNKLDIPDSVQYNVYSTRESKMEKTVWTEGKQPTEVSFDMRCLEVRRENFFARDISKKEYGASFECSGWW